MFSIKRLFYPLILGILCATVAESSKGAWLQILTLALLWREVNKHHFFGRIIQAKLGWAFGFGYFTCGLWWIYVSLHDVGGMPFWMATSGVLILSAFLAIFPAIAVWLASRFHSKSHSAIAWAAAWTLLEWLRGHVLTGFPWLGFGDLQVSGPFMGLIPIFGVLGATFASCWAAYKIGSSPERLFLPLFSVAFAVFCTSFLNNTNYTQPIGSLLEVRLLQGNFPQTLTYDKSALEKQDAYYLSQFLGNPTNLVVAPETAITIPENQLSPNWSNELEEFSKTTGTHILTGLIGFENNQYANQARGISPSKEAYTYTKAHLVPFGEYIPPMFEWFVRAIQAPLSQFEKGTFDQPLFKISRPNQPDLFGAVMICYEDAFGSEIAQRLRNANQDANLLINMTNLAWFGKTSAPSQQLRLAQLRSLETGLPTIRSTNTGFTAIINEHGQVQSKLPIFEQSSLIGSVQARIGKTPYVTYGDSPILFISFVCLLVAWYKNRYQARQ
jgi:apolipoprotein N-acyltransferase